jgi:AcrR family transcriptional regulator
MNTNSKEAILAAARQAAQSRGYSGLNFRDLAAQVGIKAASIYHRFPSKADLGAAVARRYWEDTMGDSTLCWRKRPILAALCSSIQRFFGGPRARQQALPLQLHVCRVR